MKKRSGKVIVPHGREKIVSKVFELLWKNISARFAKIYSEKMEQIYYQFALHIKHSLEDIINEKNFSLFNLKDVLEDESIFLLIENSLNGCVEKMYDDIDDLSYEFEDAEITISHLFSSYLGEFYDSFKMPEIDFFSDIDNLLNEDFIMPEINNIISHINSDSGFKKLTGIIQTARFIVNIKEEYLKIVRRIYQQMIDSFDKKEMYNHIYKALMNNINFNEMKI